MIHITRSDVVPAILKKRGAAQTLCDCDDYDTRPDDYRSGKAKFPMPTHYSAPEVKKRLVQMHHSKCCYCEKSFPPENLHVEHFRPKGGVRQSFRQADEFPGYYWLAYSWDNLLLACHACNSMNKKTLFPLGNPTGRARSHRDDVINEQALFIDPVGQDPRSHIRFLDEAPLARSSAGRTTIELIGLRRAGLREDRLGKIANIKVRLDLMAAAARYPADADLQAEAKEAGMFIEAAQLPDAEFSSMVIDYLANLGK